MDPEPPEKKPPFRLPQSPELVEEARRRGVDPRVFAERILELTAQMGREGAELFDDWKQRSVRERLRWCLDGVRERFWLEFPLVDGDQGERGDS